MLAKMSSDMPLPMPRWVMSSPIHMISAVPAMSVMTMITFVRRSNPGTTDLLLEHGQQAQCS